MIECDIKHKYHRLRRFVESQHSASDDPLAVWYTGGPGCSSLVALLDENGPFKVVC